MHSWDTFGAWTNHGQTWIQKIHHDLDLGEATTFPLIVCLAMGPTLKCHFVPKLSSWSPEIFEIGIVTTLGAHNLVCRHLIEVRFKAKL